MYHSKEAEALEENEGIKIYFTEFMKLPYHYPLRRKSYSF